MNSGGSFHIINKSSFEDLKRHVEAKYPDGLGNNYISTEQFRPNIVVDLDTPYAEDRHKEMRVGPLLFRHVGPTNRCSVIRMNFDRNCFVDENEPYKTLASYRTIPGYGVVFGNYVQIEQLNEALYKKVLPESLGYQPFEKNVLNNVPELRREDGEVYVKIYKSQGIKLRLDQEMPWSKRIIASNKSSELK